MEVDNSLVQDGAIDLTEEDDQDEECDQKDESGQEDESDQDDESNQEGAKGLGRVSIYYP